MLGASCHFNQTHWTLINSDFMAILVIVTTSSLKNIPLKSAELNYIVCNDGPFSKVISPRCKVFCFTCDIVASAAIEERVLFNWVAL